jgi:dihydroorotate dehydrogenase electron transfer subunit
MHIENGKVIQHVPIGAGYKVLTLQVPVIAAKAVPGQFIHVRIAGLQDAVLRRPFSIYRIEGETLSILYKSVGRGTEAMQRLVSGESLSIIGPLGNGFPLPLPEARTPVLVAGGYGVAPLYFLARELPCKGIVFIGGSKAADILLADEFRHIGWKVEVATEDGSLGVKGLVTVPLDAWLKTRKAELTPEFFACGPNGLLKALGRRAMQDGFKAWLSLDRHMGCGVGACLACVQKVQFDGQETLVRVCKEGPVFEARDVIWED